LGALICLADMIQVFMLNMTYDVPVKLFAFHLILLACFLLAPDLPRLVNVLFLNRATVASGPTQLFRPVRANRIVLAAQIILGLWLVTLNAYSIRRYWGMFGGGAPQSPLYGIWEVNRMTIDEEERPPLLTDNGRWRRVIFDFPTVMAFQRMDDSFAYYPASINLTDKSLALTKRTDKNWRANFILQRPAREHLILDGRMDNHQVHMELQLIERNKFLLVRRGFHWVQEFPFNR